MSLEPYMHTKYPNIHDTSPYNKSNHNDIFFRTKTNIRSSIIKLAIQGEEN